MKKFKTLSEPMKIAYITAAATLIAALMAAIIGGIFLLRSTSVGGSSPQPTSTLTPQPTTTPAAVVTPSYEHNLSSTNFNLFVNAFALALGEEDVQSIEAHTDTLHFIEDCASGGQPAYSPQGCMNDWQTVKQQIASDKVRFSIPADSLYMTVSNICRQFAGSFDVVSGSYDNAGFTLPLPHFGTAYFIFECVTCGSETTWGWQGVILC